MLKRRLKQFGKILLALILLLFAFLLFERFRGQIVLASYKGKLISQGEKLSPQDFVRHFSDDENGAPEVISAIKRLQRGRVLPTNPPPRMKLTPSGRAIVGFREDQWIEKGTYRNEEWVNEWVTNRWDQLAADLDTNKTTLTEIRAALGKPVLNHRLDLSEGMKMQFLHLAPAKSLTYWHGGGSQLALHEGRNRDALDNLLVEVRLPRLLAEDHIVISELVRIAIGAIAKADTWEALQAEGWTDESLALLQKAWESQEFATAMVHSLEGERVFCNSTSEILRASNEDAFNLMFGEYTKLATVFAGGDAGDSSWEKFLAEMPYGEELTDFARKQVYCRVWRFSWSHQAQLRDLNNLQRLIELIRGGAKDKSYKDINDACDQLISETSEKSFYHRLRYPEPDSVNILSRTILKAMKTETDRSLTICAIALKRYSLRYGKSPESLNALIPEFLASVPVDYMDGKPVKYHLNPDGSFTLYSVGENGIDDGGDTSLLPDKTSYRILWDRKDFIWPAPALAEEIEAYRKESAKQ